MQTTRTLYSGEGLTVVAELPGGAVEPPSAQTLLWYTVFDYRRWIFGSVGFLVVLGYYFAAWEAVGRDPKGGTIIPLFHPPDDISSALANYIRDWGFGREKWRAFTGTCMSLAVRGLIRLKQSGKALTLEKTGKQPDGGFDKLPAGERAIYSWVNEMGAASIDQARGERVAKVGKEFTTSIEKENRNRFFRRNLGFVIAGLVMTALVLVNVFVFGGLSDEDVGFVISLGVLGFIGTMFVVQMLQMPSGGGFTLNTIVRVLVSMAFIVVLASFVANVLQGMFHGSASETLPMLGKLVANFPFPLVLVTTFAALNGPFVYLLRAPTALGRPIMSACRLPALSRDCRGRPPQSARARAYPERFETLLPYAVALDVEKPWAHAFEAALRRAHPDDPDPMRHYSPSWTSGGSGWSGGDFSGAVAYTVGGVAGAFASAVPASSGSSGFGGGGSGGRGGGGGGGGGW